MLNDLKLSNAMDKALTDVVLGLAECEQWTKCLQAYRHNKVAAYHPNVGPFHNPRNMTAFFDAVNVPLLRYLQMIDSKSQIKRESHGVQQHEEQFKNMASSAHNSVSIEYINHSAADFVQSEVGLLSVTELRSLCDLFELLHIVVHDLIVYESNPAAKFVKPSELKFNHDNHVQKSVKSKVVRNNSNIKDSITTNINTDTNSNTTHSSNAKVLAKVSVHSMRAIRSSLDLLTKTIYRSSDDGAKSSTEPAVAASINSERMQQPWMQHPHIDGKNVQMRLQQAFGLIDLMQQLIRLFEEES
jgi:hypothetical protein